MTLEVARPSPAAGRRLALRPTRGVAAALVAFAPVVGLAGAQGGYFPSAWGWATFPLLWVVGLALALRERLRLSRQEWILIGLLFALTLWILLAAAWSSTSALSILESQRALLYAAGVAAALLVARSRDVPRLLGGLLAAICGIAAFALATRVLPDRIGVFDPTAGYRLAQPIGYWNGLAAFAGMGALIALVFASRARLLVARGACAAALVLLLPTIYFTFGRAAWLALAAGVVAAVAVDPRRLQLAVSVLTLMPLPVLGVWAASRETGLTHANQPLSRAVHDGHRLALLLLLLAVGNVVIALALAFVEKRVEPSERIRQGFAVVTVLLVVAGLVTVVARYGGPVTLAQKGYNAFKAPPPHVQGNLNKRLLSFSGNGRAALWRLAWEDTEQHPVLGAGAGTYERYFLAHQPPRIGRVRDAHGLYIETLAELGPFGLLLLVAALVVPLTVLGAARRHPLVPGAVGAYVAYLVHAGVDWDWELPAVTLTGLLCGAAILVAARRNLRPASVPPTARWTGVGIAAVAALFAAVGLLGNTALSRSDVARRNQDWGSAATDARRAHSWMPWSPKPYEALGRAQLGAGFEQAARISFRKAVSMDPGDWELWYRLASATSGAERRHALAEAQRLRVQSDFLASS